ncbi:Archaeal Lon protease [uncultured archaeon]|nr:Archaeal Lon protease [uncultured archaeon]
MNRCERSTLFVSLFLLFLLPAFGFAYSCQPATRQIFLAAVTGENSGGIFQLTVEVRPGNGSVYTAVSPRTGFATQSSEEQAVDYAFESAGLDRKGCDVLFRMEGPFGENTVDGPSAGGAMTVATIAALTNRTIRQDVVMTGTISPDGRIGPVGGIIEKSLAASDASASYIVVPKLQVYEALLLSSVSRTKPFHAIEVDDVAGAEGILFSSYSQNFTSKFNPASKPLPQSLKPIPVDADLGRFTLVAKGVVDDLDSTVGKAFAGSQESEESMRLRQYFANETSNYRKLLSLGYPFTAANAAFLLSIDAEYVKIGNQQVDVNGSIDDVSACISRLRPPAKTSENFDWAVGSDLRRIWATQKLNDTIESRSQREGYTTLRDLLYSYSWCGISESLAAQATDVGGKPVDERALAGMASDKVSEAENAITSSPSPDYDSAWHLQNAMKANESGEYGAAIYEATYALSMQQASEMPSDANISAAVEKLASTPPTSLWGKIYYGQGMYLYAQAIDASAEPADAYRILKYASALDAVSSQMKRELASSGQPAPAQTGEKPAATAAPTQNDMLVSAVLGACIAIACIAAAWRLLCRTKLVKEKIILK